MTLGIDLGTTFSVAAIVNSDGQPTVIPVPCAVDHESGQSLLVPSAIWAQENEIYVGREAVLRRNLNPRNLIEFIKQEIGKYRLDADKNILLDEFGYPVPEWQRQIAGEKYDAEELSALILTKLVRDANVWLEKHAGINRKINDVVITVPAYFGDLARKSTEMAGRLAGLNVVGIINEPTAAAIAYGAAATSSKTVLVFDLGGGTFDVTLMTVKRNGNIDVIVSDGSHTLGGKDWDVVLEKITLEALTAHPQYQFTPSLALSIREKARQAKLWLSDHETADLDLSLNGQPFQTQLTRYQFERRSVQLLQVCRAIMRNVVHEAIEKKAIDGWRSIDDIVLVGGSSRLPMIKKMVHEVSEGIPTIVEGDFDLAIAKGAALYAHDAARVVDVAPKTLGVRIDRDHVEMIAKMIEKNTTLPCSFSDAFTAPPHARVSVEQGVGDAPDGYTSVGVLDLNNAQTDEVVITYHYNRSGVVEITVNGKQTGARAKQINLLQSETSGPHFSARKTKVDRLIEWIR